MSRTIFAADLFCGAGGTSTGLMKAAERLDVDVRLLAINHWNVAVQTHAANHPYARHLTTGLESVTPADVVPGGKLDLLWASQTSGNHFGVVEPFIIPQHSCGAPHGMDAPIPTITTDGAHALVEPFMVSFYGQGKALSIHEPFATITTKDRFGIVQQYGLDILFRMLQPHELALAHSFPRDYRFAGNKGDVVKQIGNSVPSKTSEELCYAALSA